METPSKTGQTVFSLATIHSEKMALMIRRHVNRIDSIDCLFQGKVGQNSFNRHFLNSLLVTLKGVVRGCFSRPMVNQSERNFCSLFFMINVEKNGEPIF